MAQLNFNARTVDPSAVIDPIPAAWYIAAIDQSEMKPTNDGQGAFLEVRYNVLDGQYVGRKVFARFNLRNNNQQAVEIAYKQLSAVCHSTGVLDCTDSNLLHGIPHKIKVTLRQGGPKLNREGQPTGENYEPSNEIKGWKGVNEPTENVAAAAVNPGFPAGPGPAAAAPQGWGGAPQQPAAQQPQAWAPPAQPQQPAQGQQPWTQQPQQPAQQPQAQQPWAQQPAAAPAQAPQGSQPWAQQPQQPVQPPAQQPQGAPAQGWGQPPAQQPQQPAQPQGGPSAPWAQQPAQGGNMGAPAAGGAQPPWAR
mgnify:CR=1 FL=1